MFSHRLKAVIFFENAIPEERIRPILCLNMQRFIQSSWNPKLEVDHSLSFNSDNTNHTHNLNGINCSRNFRVVDSVNCYLAEKQSNVRLIHLSAYFV